MRKSLLFVAVGFCSSAFAYTLSTGEDLADPTAPYNARPVASAGAASTAVKQKPLILNYLKNAGGEKVAVINGTSVKEGDQLRGMRVVEITDSAVRLKSGNRERLVRLNTASGITRK